MRIKSQKDFYAGLMFALAGLAFAVRAAQYPVGEAARLGAGFLPLVLGLLLTGLGCGIVAESLLTGSPDGGRIGRFAWKPLGFIVAANCAFGVLLVGIPSLGIPPMGLILAIYALTFLSSLAGKEFDASEVALLATLLAVASYFVLVWVLRMQMPVWPSFLSG